MRCSECGAEMPPLREFCPNCGTATNPGLRRRPPGVLGGRSTDELKRNRKTVLIACAAMAALLAVSGKIPWHIPHGIHIDMDAPSHKGPVVTNAEVLVRAFAADPAAAEKRFGGREIMVGGEFLRIVPDGYGSIDMRLKTSNPDAPLGVDVVNDSVDDAKRLQPGQEVTVSCRSVAGSNNDRWLKDCAIQSGEPSPPAAPPPPTTPTTQSPPAPPSG